MHSNKKRGTLKRVTKKLNNSTTTCTKKLNNSTTTCTKKLNNSTTTCTKKLNNSTTPCTKNVFLKKPIFSTSSVLKTGFFEKFCRAYNLSFVDVDKDVKTAQRIIITIEEELKRYEYGNLKFKILYVLRELKYYNFERLKDKLNVYPRILTRVLNDLKKENFIINSSPYDQTALFYKDLLKYLEQPSGKSFYMLNYNNPIVTDNINEINNYVDEDFKRTIRNEENDFKRITRQYQLYQKQETERKSIIRKNKLKRVDRIREVLKALYLQYGPKHHYTPKGLIDHLHYGEDLITKKSWLGNRDQGGIYSGGWEGYLISQGLIKKVSIEDSSKDYYILLEKVLGKKPIKRVIKKVTTKTKLLNEDDIKALEYIKDLKKNI